MKTIRDMKAKRLLSILFVSAAFVLLTIRCNNDEGITYSMKDVSSRISGLSTTQSGPGAELTINGSQLGNVQRVFIGNEAVLARNFTSHTESAVTFNVPTTVGVNAPGTKTKVLIVFSGSERAFTEIEIVPLQAISGFAPLSAAPGEVITVFGVTLDVVTAVKVGDADATIISKTPSVLKFTAPAGFNTTGKVVLVGPVVNATSANDLVACTGDGVADCAPGLNLNFGLEAGAGDDFSNWGKWNGGGFMFATTVPGEYYRGERALKVVRDGSLGSGQWRIQFVSDPVDTEVGVSYTLHVWARASAAGAGFRVSLNRDTGFYPGDVALTTTWQRYSFVVPAERIEDPATRFVLDLNGTNTCCSPAINFFLDDIKIVKTP
ncbi:MAG: IPT/TIG domain-containing protein [Cyclobacteriaceae bacterium]|nr:IPT/TIG domain-containing protein [Cyclobacteriaceae bacterium]